MQHDEATQLRRQLKVLEQKVRTNEHIWSGFRQIEIDMIGSQTLDQVLSALINGLLRTFPHVDFVSLGYVDTEFELSRILRDDEGNDFRGFVALEPAFLDSLFEQGARPRLGQFDERVRATLFPEQHPDMIGSLISAPLVLHGEVVGSLNQASRDPAHYREGVATDLLQHLAAVTAMCIDNAVSHEKLKLDGLTDPLTGIFNRRFFERRMTEEIERARRSGNCLACIVVDVDHFKRINDVYGHAVGDLVLQAVAQELGRDLRGSDVLARYGGEEFVLLLPATDEAECVEIAGRLRAALELLTFTELGYNDLKVTATLGISTTRLPEVAGADAAAQAGALFECADQALYSGKQSGRNRVVMAGA